MNDGLRFLLGILVIAALAMGGWKLYEYWGTFQPKDGQTISASASPEAEEDQLPGMPPSLQSALQVARQRGATGLHDFLQEYGNTIADPRRAAIELDYVVLLAESSPGAARQEFAKVKSRVPPTSPVYKRVQDLAKTYE
jgi:hypothetical protein